MRTFIKKKTVTMLQIGKNLIICAVLRPRFLSTIASNKLKEHAQEKIVKVAVIGLPNAGKSTFINSLMDKKVRNIKIINVY